MDLHEASDEAARMEATIREVKWKRFMESSKMSHAVKSLDEAIRNAFREDLPDGLLDPLYAPVGVGVRAEELGRRLPFGCSGEHLHDPDHSSWIVPCL